MIFDYLVIGAGPAGLGALHALSKRPTTFLIVESRGWVGGHSSSYEFNEIVFDEGPHISFTKYPRLRDLFDKSANGKVRSDNAKVSNYFSGSWVVHPLMANLGQLPQPLGKLALESFLETTEKRGATPSNYFEWLNVTYGAVATEQFFVPYTRKYWGVHPSEMSMSWVNGRFFSPDKNVVIKGFDSGNSSAHYVNEFYYPAAGGFSAFFDNISNSKNIALNCKIIELNPDKGIAIDTDGKKILFKNLISTIPLPELIDALGNHVPDDVRFAASKLRCSSVYLVDFVVEKYTGPAIHWFYVYDLDLESTRVTIQTAFRKGVDQRDGNFGIQVEVYKDKLAPDEEINLMIRVKMELIKLGLFEEKSLKNSQIKFIKYANVIFDHNRENSLKSISQFLREKKISSVGRFGSWDYLWSDESFLEGVGAVDHAYCNFLKGVSVEN